MTQQYFRAWSADEDPRRPAGYLTHFSPRDGETLGSLLEFGFTGAQSLHALAAIRRGYREAVPLWISRGRQVNNFFVRECQSENGFAEGLYDTRSRSFVHWFTGILMPFQYSDDEEELRAYLGSQITHALAPIAQKLRGVPGNYTRTMCEAVYSVLLSYEEESRHGVGYTPSAEPLTSPAEWFGQGIVEQRSGTIFPIPVLASLHRLTGKAEYKEAAVRAARFIASGCARPDRDRQVPTGHQIRGGHEHLPHETFRPGRRLRCFEVGVCSPCPGFSSMLLCRRPKLYRKISHSTSDGPVVLAHRKAATHAKTYKEVHGRSDRALRWRARQRLRELHRLLGWRKDRTATLEPRDRYGRSRRVPVRHQGL